MLRETLQGTVRHRVLRAEMLQEVLQDGTLGLAQAREKMRGLTAVPPVSGTIPDTCVTAVPPVSGTTPDTTQGEINARAAVRAEGNAEGNAVGSSTHTARSACVSMCLCPVPVTVTSVLCPSLVHAFGKCRVSVCPSVRLPICPCVSPSFCQSYAGHCYRHCYCCPSAGLPICPCVSPRSNAC